MIRRDFVLVFGFGFGFIFGGRRIPVFGMARAGPVSVAIAGIAAAAVEVAPVRCAATPIAAAAEMQSKPVEETQSAMPAAAVTRSVAAAVAAATAAVPSAFMRDVPPAATAALVTSAMMQAGRESAAIVAFRPAGHEAVQAATAAAPQERDEHT